MQIQCLFAKGSFNYINIYNQISIISDIEGEVIKNLPDNNFILFCNNRIITRINSVFSIRDREKNIVDMFLNESDEFYLGKESIDEDDDIPF